MKKSLTLSLFLTLLTLFSFIKIGFSQNTTIKVFKPGEANDQEEPAYRSIDKSAIKWNYSLITRGVFMLNYEQYIAKKFTFEAGMGLTYRDYIFELFNENEVSQIFDLSNDGIGFAIHAGPRFYPSGFDNLEGLYLSPAISYRTYKLSTKDFGPKHFDLGYNFLDVQFKMGYQQESLFDWDVLTEVYWGIGYRRAAIRTYEQEDIYSSITGQQQTDYKKKSSTLTMPQILMGFKISFPL